MQADASNEERRVSALWCLRPAAPLSETEQLRQWQDIVSAFIYWQRQIFGRQFWNICAFKNCLKNWVIFQEHCITNTQWVPPDASDI